MLLAILLGTILDLFLVERKVYSYPIRPFPEAFTFNIAFTFVALPLLVLVFLHFMSQLNKWGRMGLILFLSLLMPIMEKFAEEIGFFQHSDQWKHIYSFIGYFVFLTILYLFDRWLKGLRG